MFVLGVTFGELNNGTVDLAMALADADYARPPFWEEVRLPIWVTKRGKEQKRQRGGGLA